MQDLSDLYYFVQVVDHGGFAAAARHRLAEVQAEPARPATGSTDDMAALHDAAIAGVGVAALPTMMVWRQVSAGQLARVLPDWQPPAGIVHAVFPSRRGLLPSIRTLLDFLAEQCSEARRRADG